MLIRLFQLFRRFLPVSVSFLDADSRTTPTRHPTPTGTHWFCSPSTEPHNTRALLHTSPHPRNSLVYPHARYYVFRSGWLHLPRPTSSITPPTRYIAPLYTPICISLGVQRVLYWNIFIVAAG
ncbi:hypothetical protein DFH09DRAFT_364119 [Mycena vulgaris]|nr:hypothetical protein DFH09DRAFT_364119 [Mycena vulgaris]